ncbi:endonuclease domain-containing protein [Rufibacter quisquiliarum]|uniref:Very-short-patch-repair endonuclease n=1 Tax=Rufibacter quisquiliarum TaxID=1549639 RepID=A0A839GB39_9BACT|nr:endonuclease domain-containing protein [Rufibacter quisquiliarum]MBA9076142.1 very-short-patch-repair endonuclease [Rufibacter quisquiliarum]
MPDNHHYNKHLKPLAKVHRADSTKAEIRLWCELLSKGKMGVSFLRQRPIGNYIADFLCKELKLIIEVDGYSHNFKTDEDTARDKELTALGFTVLRFTDAEVIHDFPNVQRTLETWIAEKKGNASM